MNKINKEKENFDFFFFFFFFNQNFSKLSPSTFFRFTYLVSFFSGSLIPTNNNNNIHMNSTKKIVIIGDHKRWCYTFEFQLIGLVKNQKSIFYLKHPTKSPEFIIGIFFQTLKCFASLFLGISEPVRFSCFLQQLVRLH